MRAGVLAVLITVAAIAPARAAEVLQPGARLATHCTLNFVYDGQGPLAGRTFIGTAAHCVEHVGARMQDGAGVGFGYVALMGTEGPPWPRDLDFALIEVDPEDRARVEPSMAGHAQLPRGVAESDDVEVGDLLQMSGWGGVYRETQETRERRQAVLTEYLGDRFNSLAPVNGGDSGGPIAHVDSGLALGTVSGLDFVTPGTLNGPTVSNIVAASASFGFPIRMRAAGEPPPAPPQPASPPPAGGPPPDQAQERPAAKRKKRKACRKKARRGKRARRCRRR